jgi:RHS repeat-associated protein
LVLLCCATAGWAQTPTINLQTTDSYAAEAGPDTGTFTITRTGSTNSAVTVQLAITGTASNGVDFTTLPTSVTLAAGVVVSNLAVTPITDTNLEPAETVVLSLKTNTAYVLGLNTNGVVTIAGEGAEPRDGYPMAERYVRGAGTNLETYSIVVPLEGLRGTKQPEWVDSIYPTRYHYDGSSALDQSFATNRIKFDNPIVSFGGEWGQSLYIGQPYHLGVFFGVPSSNPILIYVYGRSSGSIVTNLSLALPDPTSSNDWANFVTSGFARTVEGFGIKTVLRRSLGTHWGTYVSGYTLSHTASAEATNYYYVIATAGFVGSQYMVTSSGGALAYETLYELTFDPRPAWRSLLLDQPHFSGQPLPPDLWNKTPEELQQYGALVTNTVSLTASSCTNLDQSPELRRHPSLDQLVSDLNRDPLALANYVFNEIDLTDAIAFRDDGQVANESVNLGGVNRSALGVYREGQGSPTEQCALLVYLLRQAGYPAAYVYPPDGGLKLLDTRAGQLLRMRLKGGQDAEGRLYTTNRLIAMNYPWVATYIGNQWVHLFPWLKDTEVIEGLDLYDYLPDPYKDEQLWVKDYILGQTNLMAFATLADDTPATIYPRWLKNALEQNAPGISLDDIGMHYVNRRHLYATWNEFPRPTWVTNTSIAVESLTASAITNVSPRLTNIFDTIAVELVSVANPLKKIETAEMRVADLHNRKFFVTHTNISGSQYRAILYLAPYRPDATGTGSFASADTGLTNKQVATMTLDGTDDQLVLRLRHRRQKALAWETALDPDRAFLDLVGGRAVLKERPLRKGDVGAICFSAGRVTPAMLRVHAQELWGMEQQLGTNAAAASTIAPEVSQGSLLYLAGMSYYERAGRFGTLNRKLHKVQSLSSVEMGLAKVSPRRNTDGTLVSGAVDPIWPNLDMFYQEVFAAGNGTVRLDSGWDRLAATRNCFDLLVANDSAQEHAVLNTFYGQSNSVSTVKVLQLAQSKVNTGAPPVVELNSKNYQAEGNKLYNGTALKNHNPSIWASVEGILGANLSGAYSVAWMPPGTQTNANGSFSGMAALVLGVLQKAALIGNNQYGGYASQLPSQTFSSSTFSQWEVRMDAQDNYSWRYADPTAGARQFAPGATAWYDVPSDATLLSSGAFYVNPFQDLAGQISGLTLNGRLDTYANTYGFRYDLGDQGQARDRSGNSIWGTIADPVDTLTGEFYVDEVDLVLPGPMPLSLRRNYGSQNLSANQLGYGWKLTYMPFLTLAQTNDLIYVSEREGSVLAYSKIGTNLWAPTADQNPTLNNHSTAGIGALANRFNARLVKVFTNSVNTYYLTNTDGSLRVFEEKSFPLSAGIDRLRPYLVKWHDNRGNFHAFDYGTNVAQADYGQVRRIVNNGGNVLLFQYDVAGRVVDAYCLDGRRVRYDYDEQGDLASVTRPDTSQIRYEYQLATLVTNSATNIYSTHLLTKELKPDGRVLFNEYDPNRRVTNQWNTSGPDLRLVRSATFRYTNNFNLTNLTATLSGTTTVLDYTNNATTYSYSNSLVRRIRDPLGAEVVQAWYEAAETNAPAYPRSLKSVTDKRGLVTDYQYDGRGNVTNQTLRGDLLGDGNTNTTATSVSSYNAQNLIEKNVDASGTTNLFFYTNTWLLARQEIWPLNASGAQAITNLSSYYSVTNTTNGTASFGLRQREIRAAYSSEAATNEWAYDARGFVTQATRYTGTTDPAVTLAQSYNYRGELVEQTDAAGRTLRLGFDPAGRPQRREVFESGASLPASWEYSYYNENGEPTWSDGPRFDPEDYVWRDYDGSGRKTQEIRWRSKANSTGTGVEAESGDNLYVTTFLQYDPFDNLTQVIDPLRRSTLKRYDPLGRLLREEFYEYTGALLATNGFAYSVAGDVTNIFNALGGLTEKQYAATGKPKYQKNPDGSTNAWRYYADGRVEKEIQRNGAYWQSTYDDANRKTTRIFYTSAGAALATNVTELDRRGNAIKTVDAIGSVYTNLFDGLDRLKVAAGPRLTNAPPAPLPGAPQIIQEITTHFYDASGQTHTVSNMAGERTVTATDALGRTASVDIYASNGVTPIRITDYVYATNHHSMTVWQGSGTNAIGTTTFTDNDGRTVLTVQYPAGNARHYLQRDFDFAGNPTYEKEVTDTNGVATEWRVASFNYDGLNRLRFKVDRDFANTTFDYDAGGNLTNRSMSSGVKWQARFNSANQMLEEKDVGTDGSTATRVTSYTYYPANSVYAGLPQTRTDGRSVVCTYAYDTFLRPATNTHTGSLAEQNLTTTWQYDARGLVRSFTESFASTNTGPVTRVLRGYDGRGLLLGDSVLLDSSLVSSVNQGWDSAGRRSSLSFDSFRYQFAWRADGLLAGASGNTGGGAYSYNDAGLLTSRVVGSRTTTIGFRDGAGHALTITTAISGTTRLAETLAWTGDGLPSTHTMTRSDFTDSREFFYGDYSRRLIGERLNLDGTKRWTNSFNYDNDGFGGPGVLTRQGQPETDGIAWSGTTDGFARVNNETSKTLPRVTHGRMNGPASITALLDGRPAPVRVISTGNTNAPYQWRATLDLTPGAHQLQVNAVHPSGQFSTNATLWFTNKVTQLAATDSFDAAGYLTNRVWKNPGGKTNRVQSLAWDARGRLYRITDRITQFSNTVAIATNGVELTATYDALGRLLRTREIPISNNVALASQPTVIDRYYDPQVEFLEVGVSENGRTTWKLMGPDTDGVYGGQNGTGGFEAIVPGPELFCPILSDAHGNLHAVYDQTHANLMWYASRLTGYGAVPGYQSVPLGQASADLGAKYVWRNRAMTSVGLSWMGGNWYDPVAGQFLSFDPAGHAGSDSGYSFCSGNPYGFWDPDGRFTKQAATVTAGWAYDQLYGAGAILTTVSAGIIGDSLNVVGPAVGNPHLGDWFNQWSQYYHNNSAPAAQAGLYDASDPNIQAASFGLALATLRPGMAPTPVTTAKTGATAAEDVTYLYQKVGAEGEHLKFGITKNPATRYTQEELGGGQLRILTEGPRKDMLQLERNLHETLPIGPEEAQKFYIQKQIEKGLKPPPYNP